MEMLLYSEVNILSIVVMLIIAISAMRINRPMTHKTMLFVASVLLAALANAFDFVWNLGMTYVQNISVDVRCLINFCYFVSLGASTYFWFLYTETVFNGTRMSKRNCILSAIPLFVLAGLLVTSYFTGCAFYFDADGNYYRGPFFFCQHVLAYGYILLTSAVCLKRAAATENYDRKGELLTMAAFIVPPVICALMQTFLQQLPILSVGIVVSFILVFVQAVSNMISKDELTQIANRKEMLRYLSSEIRNLKSEDNLYLMFLDIDHFKQVNDLYGHAHGDKALTVMASVLRRISAETEGFCARYGGDEFIFIIKCSDEREVVQLKKKIQQLARQRSRDEKLERELSVSIGYVRYKTRMHGIQQFIAAADAAMYAERESIRAHQLH